MTERNPQEDIKSRTTKNRVSIYCTIADKEQWTTEAETGYRSRSEYLYELVQESRRYRAEGFLSREQKQEEIRRLKSEIDRLEAELENEVTRGQGLVQSLENPELAKRVLSTQYQSLQELTSSLLAHDIIAVNAREPVERALYQLAQRDEVEYRRGHGWRLTEEDR